MADLNKLYDAICVGKLNDAVAITQQAIAENLNPQEIIDNYLIKAMQEVGNRFERGEAFVPEMLIAARAMKGSLELLRPLLQNSATAKQGKVVIGTVKGDLHDIGKNLVASMLEGCGFEVINLGVDVSPEKFVESVRQHSPNIVCMSALLSTTMNMMKEVITALETEGYRSSVKVMIGGAPVNNNFAQQIGADGYSDNANSAVALARTLVSA